MSEQVPSQAGRVLPQADFPLEEMTVVFLFEGPARAAMAQTELQRLLNEHLHFTVGLVAAGHLLHAGAILDSERDPTVTGLAFSRKEPDEVARLVGEDPAVKAGVEVVRVARYRFPKGGLQFAREQASLSKA